MAIRVTARRKSSEYLNETERKIRFYVIDRLNEGIADYRAGKRGNLPSIVQLEKEAVEKYDQKD